MIADALKMAIGTLTTVRVPAPGVIDRRVAGGAMVLAPPAVVPLAAVASVIVFLGELIGLPAFASAALALGAVALGSRGLHLDGLADTADGLGASYDRARALEVMRRGDSGPTGIATLLLVLLVQVGALAGAISAGHGIAAAAVAVVAGRGVLSLCCARGVPSARPEGLGATVAGSVPVWAAAVVFAVLAGAAALVLPWWQGLAAVALGYLAAAALLARCVQRLGGVTGDVLGGCVEVAVAGVLLASSF
ncbi:adenosylcobinamide-GDP ribazoletransferase [Amycolatopsis roodepoortensis]|uniref:adenosylcobinamide-GDP ribazoletransferase n=1 Tax=Amycolatopsis roodepoortensis TaxID=700274 RepID=UPI00214BF647|nr:adenosylcobinamide-GDP ribazoletransferase [Amycolatopsis roodepoortensis]UUV34617.1 adenosylcobinamide-GDP ribazoletransferase [Amycolatopsis roodepoortensis]